jgi:ribonuclease VapC
MFIDASVIVAVMTREPGWEAIVERLDGSETSLSVSSLARFEAVLALARKQPSSSDKRQAIASAREAVANFLSEIRASEVTVTPRIGELALDAATAYGKTAGHPAALNFGDCFAYACAKALGVSLVYKGDDFALTDLA